MHEAEADITEGEDYIFSVQIVRCVDDGQPPVVECRFVDAWEQEWCFVDKAPIFTDAPFEVAGPYPQRGAIRCRLVRELIEGRGRLLRRVDTSLPDAVETVDGQSRFDLEILDVGLSWRD